MVQVNSRRKPMEISSLSEKRWKNSEKPIEMDIDDASLMDLIIQGQLYNSTIFPLWLGKYFLMKIASSVHLLSGTHRSPLSCCYLFHVSLFFHRSHCSPLLALTMQCSLNKHPFIFKQRKSLLSIFV